MSKYQDYLKSEHWAKKRQSALKRGRYKCLLCDSKDNLNVHHLYYQKKNRSVLYKETKGTLKVLCRECHSLWHDTFGLKQKKTTHIDRLQNLIKNHGVDKRYAFEVMRENKYKDCIKKLNKESKEVDIVKIFFTPIEE